MSEPLRPPPLTAGDRIAVVAPSGSFSRLRFKRGLATLEDRYEVVVGESVFARDGYLAGDDAARAGDLRRALADTEVKAIVAARGGFGATRVLEHLRPEEVRDAGKWLIGFSDITALHALWARAGVLSIHGPMVCSLPEAPAETQRDWFDVLEGKPWRPLAGESWRGGVATGPLRGGNLAVLTALCGTPHAPDLDGAVLLLEDVAERPYRLDRMLTTLRQSGLLDRVAGIALGQFTQCDPGEDGTSWQRAARRNLLPLGVPIVADLPVGHVQANQPLVLGEHVRLDGTRAMLERNVELG